MSENFGADYLKRIQRGGVAGIGSALKGFSKRRSAVFWFGSNRRGPRQIQISKEESAASRYRLWNQSSALPLKLPLRSTLKILNFLLETVGWVNVENRPISRVFHGGWRCGGGDLERFAGKS